MYLSDRDLKTLLPEISFKVSDPDHPFVPEDQIQPCSIDLRLDNVFGRQRHKGHIDLRRSKLLELSPRHHWTKIILRQGECITLKPGQMLLGRTYESFTIPSCCAGKLEGRSSFARMGLSVHCSADFINPGYRGKMPLELINFGKSPIRIFPLVPICQIMFIRLTTIPDQLYGARELSSKYMDDDGGPSYWWRDKRIKALHKAFGNYDVVENVQAEILDIIGPCEPELIERFEHLIRKLPKDQLSNANDILDRFAKAEDRSYLWHRVLRGVQVGLAPILIGCSIGSFYSQPFGWTSYGSIHYALWAVALVSIPLSIAGLRITIDGYLGVRDLERARRRLVEQRSN